MSDKKITLEFNLYPGDDSYWDRTSLSVEVNEDMNITTLHNICRRFAIVLGYSPITVDEFFGEESDELEV